MTNPPEGRDVPGAGEPAPERPVWTTEPVQPYRQPTAPQPAPPPYGPPQYGQPGYGQPAQPAYGQPAYGQPAAPQYGAPGQYGGGYAQPAKKSKAGLIAGLVVLLVLVIGAVLLFVFLGGSTVLDQGAVERDVAAQFQEREGVAVELTCPADMEVSSGATYECTGQTERGEDVTIQIAITDEASAAYTWTEP